MEEQGGASPLTSRSIVHCVTHAFWAFLIKLCLPQAIGNHGMLPHATCLPWPPCKGSTNPHWTYIVVRPACALIAPTKCARAHAHTHVCAHTCVCAHMCVHTHVCASLPQPATLRDWHTNTSRCKLSIYHAYHYLLVCVWTKCNSFTSEYQFQSHRD